jgi:hypothetical protein
LQHAASCSCSVACRSSTWSILTRLI